MTRFLEPSQPTQWYTLTLATTYAGNLFVLGSIANLIVVEQARNLGISISFRAHAKVGSPVTIFSILTLIVWVLMSH